MKKDTIILFKGSPYKDFDKKGSLRIPIIPLALISLAAPLRDAGYQVKIIDQDKPVSKIYSELGNIWESVICVGISALTGREITEGIKFAQEIKNKQGAVPIIWGGWHVSVLPEESMKHPCVDIIVKGLGQKAFVEVVKCLEDRKALDTVKNVYYKENGKIISTGSQVGLDLEEYSLPAFDVLDLESYRKHSLFLRYKEVINGIDITGQLYYVSSFGCPQDCSFCCSRIVFGRRIYNYDQKDVVAQIKWLVNEKGFNSISFMDANFFINIKRVKAICELLIKENIKFVWDAQMYVKDIIRYEQQGLWETLKKSGCWRVNVGSETGSQNILDYIKKKIKITDIHESAMVLVKNNVEAAYNFLFSLPNVETKKDVYASFKLAKELKKINSEFTFPISFYVPFPGTEMYDDAIKRGFVPPDNLEAWGDYDANYDTASDAYAWKSSKMERLIMNVLTFYLPLAVPGNMYRGTIRQIKDKMKTSPWRVFIWIAHYLAKVRVKLSFYNLPLEVYIFKFYHFLKGKSAYLPGGRVTSS